MSCLEKFVQTEVYLRIAACGHAYVGTEVHPLVFEGLETKSAAECWLVHFKGFQWCRPYVGCTGESGQSEAPEVIPVFRLYGHKVAVIVPAGAISTAVYPVGQLGHILKRNMSGGHLRVEIECNHLCGCYRDVIPYID